MREITWRRERYVVEVEEQSLRAAVSTERSSGVARSTLKESNNGSPPLVAARWVSCVRSTCCGAIALGAFCKLLSEGELAVIPCGRYCLNVGSLSCL